MGRKRHKNDHYNLKELINVVTNLMDNRTVPREQRPEKEKVMRIVKVKVEPDVDMEGRLVNME